MNLLHRGATKLGISGGWQEPRQFHELWSNQMRRMLSFTFGVLIGTVVATAWAQYHNFPTVDSPRNQVEAVGPHGVTVNTQALPVQQYDAI
jgi:hypothetical protein